MPGKVVEGVVGDGKDVVVEVLGVLPSEGMAVAGGVDIDGLLVVDACERDVALFVNPELELGIGVGFALLAPLQIGESPAGLSRNGAVGVAAKHEVDNRALAEAFGCLVGGTMGEQDGGVALPGGFQLGGKAVGDGVVLLDGVAFARELRGHDAHGVVFGKTDNAYLHVYTAATGIDGRLFHNDVVFGAGDPVAVLVEVCTDHGHLVDVVAAVVVVVEQRGVGVDHVLKSPVEVVVAQRHCIVFHLVERDIDGLAQLKVGDGGALVEVAAVEQQEPFFPVGSAVAADVLHLVGDVGQPVVDGVGGGVDNVAVDVGGFDEGQQVVACGRFEGVDVLFLAGIEHGCHNDHWQ